MANTATEIDTKGGAGSGLMVAGVLEIVLGLLIMAFAGFTTFFTVMFLGVFVAVRGLIGGVQALQSRHEEGFWWRLAGGILALVVGIYIVTRPGVTAEIITAVLGLFLVTTGLFRAIAAPLAGIRSWGWVMASGIASLILGLLIFAQWPLSAIWFIGILIGAEALIDGIALVSMSATAAPRGAGQPRGAVQH